MAILRLLQRDGWDGVWVDTFHGEKLFWNGLPDRTQPCFLPAKAEALYDKIVARRSGKAGGFFDVFAWRGSKFLFLEYKGEGDKLKKNQLLWIRAATKPHVLNGRWKTPPHSIVPCGRIHFCPPAPATS